MFYIKSEDNPADLGTKFTRFQNTCKKLGDDSLFRQGPSCLKKGIKKAIEAKDLIPANKINPNSKEKESASLEIVKLHQLVITDQREENLRKPIEPEEAIEEEEIEDTDVCLLTFNKEIISDESWLNRRSSGYRTQKATLSV